MWPALYLCRFFDLTNFGPTCFFEPKRFFFDRLQRGSAGCGQTPQCSLSSPNLELAFQELK